MLERVANIILILIIFSSCSTLKLAEIISNDILDNINNGGDRYDYSYTNIISSVEESEDEITIDDAYFNINTKEVRNMENGLNEVITALGSAIAGIYCLVKTIINLIKKIKK